MEQLSDWTRAGAAHLWRPYAQMKTAAPALPVVRTEGTRIYLNDGRALIDGVASWWTACHGYNHPHIIGAMKRQLDIMPHVMFGGLTHEPAARLAGRLAGLLPGDLDHVFFAESGSVAVEIAMKMALQYHRNRGETGRNQFISFRGGYHGDTLAAMAVCDPEEGMHKLLAGVMPPQHVVHLPRAAGDQSALDVLLARHDKEIAAILVEPLVQGAGGMVMHEPEVLRRLRRLADKHGLLLIFDEIFTGFGRTGGFFAMEEAGVVPDIVTLSKALTGGVAPLSAAIAREHVFDAFWNDAPDYALMHGPTYMAHALGCAAANASLDLFADGLWRANVVRLNQLLNAGLQGCRDMRGVADVRVKGAIGVVEMAEPVHAGRLIGEFVDRGLWIKPFGKIIYLTPAFIASDDDITQLTDGIRAVLA